MLYDSFGDSERLKKSASGHQAEKERNGEEFGLNKTSES